MKNFQAYILRVLLDAAIIVECKFEAVLIVLIFFELVVSIFLFISSSIAFTANNLIRGSNLMIKQKS